VTKLGTEESIRTFMLGQYDPDPKPPTTPGPNDLKVNHSNSAAWAVRANTMLWKRIAALHLRDVEDIENHISSLRNALPPMPGQDQDQVHVKSPFVPPRPNAEQLLVHPYPDTRDHLLFATEDDPVEARRHTSRDLNPYDPYGDLEEPQIPAKV
jgi:hypothetical protein